jgi:hypothetical protein
VWRVSGVVISEAHSARGQACPGGHQLGIEHIGTQPVGRDNQDSTLLELPHVPDPFVNAVRTLVNGQG